MIEIITIISFIVFAIYYTMQEGEIFGFIGRFIEHYLPAWTHSPLYACPVCMCFWYGWFLYWAGASLELWRFYWHTGLFIVIAAMGLNVILVKLFPDKDNG